MNFVAAGIVVAFIVGAASGAYWRNSQWENKWQAREIAYQQEVIVAQNKALDNVKKEQEKYHDASENYEAEIARLAILANKPPRTIRVCKQPTVAVPGAGEGASSGGSHGATELRGPTGDSTETVLNADSLILIGRRCDAQVTGLQSLLR